MFFVTVSKGYPVWEMKTEMVYSHDLFFLLLKPPWFGGVAFSWFGRSCYPKGSFTHIYLRIWLGLWMKVRHSSYIWFYKSLFKVHLWLHSVEFGACLNLVTLSKSSICFYEWNPINLHHSLLQCLGRAQCIVLVHSQRSARSKTDPCSQVTTWDSFESRRSDWSNSPSGICGRLRPHIFFNFPFE